MFQVGVTVSTVGEPARSFTDRFRVDTGALYTFVPEDRLHAIGVAPLRSRELLLADGVATAASWARRSWRSRVSKTP